MKWLLLLLISIIFAALESQAWLTQQQQRRKSHGTLRDISSTSIMAASPQRIEAPRSQDNNNDDEEEDSYYMVEVTYEGRSCEVPIRINETILSGLERNRVPDRLAIPELPSECRRGNCLTCVGRHMETSQQTSLLRAEDGLSPEMSRQAEKLGYILTCSSHVVGNGLQVELGENYRAWDDLYSHRLLDESTQFVGRAAMAKTIRQSDERNPQRWAVETKNALEKSGGNE